MALPSLVVKVGGSLYDLPDLGTRLHRWLERQGDPNVILVPGGGATADAIRAFDTYHALGEEKAHWLALRALTLNAYFLADLWPGARVVQRADDCLPFTQSLTILDAYAFARWDEKTHPAECLPPCWEATSDSLAARVAVVTAAARLCLLKSTQVPDGIDWTNAKQGLVDPFFSKLLDCSTQRLRVEAINLRSWHDVSV